LIEPGVRNLPLIVALPAKREERPPPPCVLWVTGDGGWGPLDQQIIVRLNREGLPVFALNSFLYFHRRRSTSEIVAALARMATVCRDGDGQRPILYVGYSFGADIGPFIAKDLARAAGPLLGIVLLSPSAHADFKRGIKSWMGFGSGPFVGPAIERITEARVLCVHGERESLSSCPPPGSANVDVITTAGGHELADDWDQVTEAIIQFTDQF
jgi:type IV secretory pathway VirJ component